MRRTRLRPEDRRALVVNAAFAILAADGFEGLRTRDVAKEHLVAGIAERLAERFTKEKARHLPGQSTLVALRQQFADVRFYQEHRSDLIAVYRELAARALRDDVTRALVEQLNARWHATVEAILRRGMDEGVFRRNLVPSSAAASIIAALWGAVAFFRLSPAKLALMCLELEKGLVAKGGTK